MNKLLLVIIAILLPPLAVFLKSGAGKDLLINILLCILFWMPGSIGLPYRICLQRHGNSTSSLC
jgi:uncharacterized membrane protein YqaE (UPF0057 family)